MPEETKQKKMIWVPQAENAEKKNPDQLALMPGYLLKAQVVPIKEVSLGLIGLQCANLTFY